MNQPFHNRLPNNIPPSAFRPDPQPPAKKSKAAIFLAAIGLPVAFITGCTVGVGSSGATASPSATVTVTAEPEIVEVPAADDDGSYDDGYADGKAEAESAAQEAADEAEAEQAAKDAEAEQAAQEAEQSVIGDGTYKVGSEIEAGEYKLVADPDWGCYWSRNTDSSGEFESIITNGIIEEGTGYVTVNDGEYLELSGCEAVKA